VSRLGELTLAHIAALVDDVVTVDDQMIARAVLVLAERAKQVVEPSGATGVAALLAGAVAPLTGPVVAVLCGGNVDPLLLTRIIQSGLVSEGRYLAFRTRVQDRPGALLRVLHLMATHGANVVGVEHHRVTPKLGLMEVELELALETRGADHSDELVDRLRDAGYPVER
jgi:threonine dehydratase